MKHKPRDTDARAPASERARERTDFDKPDAPSAARSGESPKSSEPQGREDAEHGYSQDSGYSESGGAPADAGQRVSREGPRQLAHGKRNGDGMAHSDEQIRSDLQARLSKEGNLHASDLRISIGDGIVTLRGVVANRGAQERLVDIVRSVPSVREVRQELHLRAVGPAN